jgi:fructosamine-3-kinase
MVAKVDDGPQPALDIEGFMLSFLAENSTLPVPEVYHSSPGLLLMEWVSGRSRFGEQAERHAAELLAELHEVTAPRFGLERDTLIGGLPQPNPQSDDWLPFFGQQRLLYMAREAEAAGRLPSDMRRRVETVAGRLERWLMEPEAPALIHGDVWTTNVLAAGGRIVAFLDPAIYFAHPEIELAFITLFGTFGRPFFRRYEDRRAIAPGFFEERKDLYNLYPLLVHVRLFGGSYVQSVARTLRQYGF